MIEEETLISLVKKYGLQSWAKISRDLGSRTDVQCRFRYTQIIRKRNKKEIEEISKIEKVFGNLSNKMVDIMNSHLIWDDSNLDEHSIF